MANNIESLLNDIINTNKDVTDNKIVKSDCLSGISGDVNNHFHPATFDKGEFKEKLAMYVLKDLVCAMMHNETKDIDGMIDDAIIDHIKNDYRGTCFGYLTSARDRLKSPMIGDIIQEIEDHTNQVAEEIKTTGDPSVAEKETDVKSLLSNVNNYDEFVKKLSESVTKSVIEDVSNVVSKKSMAPVFDNIDKKIKGKSANDVKSEEENDITKESVILNMCGNIVQEFALKKTPISTEEGLDRAICYYCINKLDYLMKQHPRVSIYAKYLKR